MKNHYLLTQISDILMKLYLAGTKVLQELKQTIKNTSSRLLETFRRDMLSDEDVFYIKNTQQCISSDNVIVPQEVVGGKYKF